MPITALAGTTKRLLCSSLVIATPVTLVKELLDNAIDAKATAVEVIISPNTIDRIEVRDNGTGIHPDDYDCLGRCGYTSKLKTFEDLMTLAGKSLGFRGEALASANALANITVTTKTSSDPMAAILHIVPKTGGILKQQPASAPVGTTVSITGLFSELPVREQVVVKEAAKSMDEIKELLRSYAMARPQVRLALKVLKTPNLTWTYAPKRGAGIREAVLQLFGTAAAAHCFEKTSSFGGSTVEDVAAQSHHDHPHPRVTFEAVMVNPDANPSQLPKHRYFSVDGRPLTRPRGTMKKIMSIYYKYLSNGVGTQVGAKSPSDVFLRLNINCAPGSYDVNIEPAKNDVLFEDEATILSFVKQFCEDVYGPLDMSQDPSVSRVELEETNLPTASIFDHVGECENLPSTPNAQSERITPRTKEAGGKSAIHLEGGSVRARPEYAEMHDQVKSSETENLLRSALSSQRTSTPLRPRWNAINKPVVQDQISASEDPDSNLCDTPGPTNKPGLGCDMSADLSDWTGVNLRAKKHLKSSQPFIHQAVAIDANEVHPNLALSPWSIARTKSLHQPAGTPVTPATFIPQPERILPQDMPLGLSFTPEPDILYHQGAPPRDLDVPPRLRNTAIRGNENYKSNSVPGKQYQSPTSSPSDVALHNRPNHSKANGSLHRRAQPPWTPPSSLQRDQEGWEDRYSVGRRASPDGLLQTTISFNGSQHPRKSRRPQVNDEGVQTQSQQVVDSARPAPISSQKGFSTARQKLAEEYSYSSQKQEAVEAPVPRPNPHRNTQRQNPLACLHSTNMETENNVEDTEPIPTSIPSGDPRAYLLRRQKSAAADEGIGKPRKFRRLKSSLMPLEHVPADHQIHHLILFARMDILHLPMSLKHIERYDQYVVERGSVKDALDINPIEACRIEQRLDTLLSQWGKELIGEGKEVKSDFSALLKGEPVGALV
jgi:DNA mismatch repair protein MutL